MGYIINGEKGVKKIFLGPSFKLFQDGVAWYDKKLDLSHKSGELHQVIDLFELAINHNILSH